MSEESYTAEQIASFLANNPDFFEDHAAIFADLRVPHPHKAQAISLGERQILTLRARLKDNEAQLQNLVYNASGNQKINQQLMAWCARMLSEADAQQIPAHIIRSLSDQFDLDSIALRLWNLDLAADSEFAADVDAAVIEYANALKKPYCGPSAEVTPATWLAKPAQSIAVMPLLRPDNKVFGLLVFGSDEATRFSADMGTEFLELIALLAAAALGRLGHINV